MTPPRRAASAASSVLVPVLLLGGCGIRSDGEPEDLHLDPQLLAPVTAPSAADDGTVSTITPLYLVQDGRLVRVTREVPIPIGADQVVEVLLAAPSAAESNAGLGTAIPAGTALAAVEVTDGVAVVDLSGEFAHMGGHEAVLAVAQLVLTLTDLDEVRAVALAIDGDRTAAPTVDGSLSQGPVTGGEYASLLRPGT